ncbi:MAG: hypothetical protein CMD67_04885 [Gammaproteobacteria bacterium]|jgi:alkanesulfonate monooxygenase SsuD/methylene tetrahydromethanopterin reductase-like flavin-dependent oxidoreductase (luciferase family)|nr:hypothetical protein [Gammaproteobacteria bacterium]
MKVGIFLTTQFEEGENLTQSIDSILQQVEVAKVAGLDSVWAGQHFATGPVKMFQMMPILCRIAAISGEMQIGTAISLLSMQSPVRVAEEISTLDWLTKGRVIFGAGIGYRDDEFVSTGHHKSTRAKRFTEAIELLRLWWKSEKVTFHGDFFNMSDIGPSLHPYQKNGPKIWIAGEVEASVKRAATIGDAWIPLPIPDNQELMNKLNYFKEQRKLVKKESPYEQPLMREVYISSNDEEAYKEVSPHLLKKYKTYASWGQEESSDSLVSIEENFKSFCSNRFLIGGPESITKAMLDYKLNFGITHLICRIQWPGLKHEQVERSIKLIGECAKLIN